MTALMFLQLMSSQLYFFFLRKACGHLADFTEHRLPRYVLSRRPAGLPGAEVYSPVESRHFVQLAGTKAKQCRLTSLSIKGTGSWVNSSLATSTFGMPYSLLWRCKHVAIADMDK